jgi:hypothetical protein
VKVSPNDRLGARIRTCTSSAGSTTLGSELIKRKRKTKTCRAYCSIASIASASNLFQIDLQFNVATPAAVARIFDHGTVSGIKCQQPSCPCGVAQIFTFATNKCLVPSYCFQAYYLHSCRQRQEAAKKPVAACREAKEKPPWPKKKLA